MKSIPNINHIPEHDVQNRKYVTYRDQPIYIADLNNPTISARNIGLLIKRLEIIQHSLLKPTQLTLYDSSPLPPPPPYLVSISPLLSLCILEALNTFFSPLNLMLT